MKVFRVEKRKEMKNRHDKLGLLLITHYKRLLDYIEPTHVHIMHEGKILKTGGMEIVEELEKDGYKNYILEKPKKILIGECATRVGLHDE